MAVTLSEFREHFPEFDDTEDALVQKKLDEAQERVGSFWGEHEDQGHRYLAAHLLSMSPYGRQGRRSNDTNTTYGDEYRRLQRIVAFGYRSIGTGCVIDPVT